MKKSNLTLASILFLSALNSQAAMTRTNFDCQIEGEATERTDNSVIKYRGMGISFLKDSSGRTERMDITLRGSRTTNLQVPVGYKPPANLDDATSLMISEKDFRFEPSKDMDKENKGSGRTTFSLGSGSNNNQARAIEKQGQTLNLASSAQLAGSVTKIYLDGTSTTQPDQPVEEKYDVITTVNESLETLTYDYMSEVLDQEFKRAEIIAENNQRELINESRRAAYEVSMLQYSEDLRSAQAHGVFTNTPSKKVIEPLEPRLEEILPVPNNPIDISYDFKQYAPARHQPKSVLNIVLNSKAIANLECVQSNNLVDNKTKIEGDVKGKYNEKAAPKAQAADPRAGGFGGQFALPTINRMEREMWCLKTTLVGSVNLAHFNKGNFKVKCEFTNSIPSDN